MHHQRRDQRRKHKQQEDPDDGGAQAAAPARLRDRGGHRRRRAACGGGGSWRWNRRGRLRASTGRRARGSNRSDVSVRTAREGGWRGPLSQRRTGWPGRYKGHWRHDGRHRWRLHERLAAGALESMRGRPLCAEGVKARKGHRHRCADRTWREGRRDGRSRRMHAGQAMGSGRVRSALAREWRRRARRRIDDARGRGHDRDARSGGRGRSGWP